MAIFRVGELRDFLGDVPATTEIHIFTDDNGDDFGRMLGVLHKFEEAGTQIGGHLGGTRWGPTRPCKGDAFAPYLDAPMPRCAERTCATCGKASKEVAEAAMREIYGVGITLPGPYGKCLGPRADKEAYNGQ